MTKQQIILALTLAILGSSALAQEHQGRPGPFANLDSDGDGNISFVEFQQADNPMLARLDNDGDGFLSLDEFLNASPQRGQRNADREPDPQRLEQMQARRQERATGRFREMDLDGDGFVSKAELQESSFVRLDRDNNKLLSADELRPPRQRGPGHGGPRSGREGSRRGQSAQD